MTRTGEPGGVDVPLTRPALTTFDSRSSSGRRSLSDSGCGRGPTPHTVPNGSPSGGTIGVPT